MAMHSDFGKLTVNSDWGNCHIAYTERCASC
jgi:hypothetical protein